MRGLTVLFALLTAGVMWAEQPWLDTGDRESVARSAAEVLHPSTEVEMLWNGDISAGAAGDVSPEYRDLVLSRINWMRRMAGVPGNIVFEDAYNQAAQEAALLISANNRVSHQPPASWKYYSAVAGNAAQHSNLCLGAPEWDAGCVFNYMEDEGPSNEAVAHRRWLLYPATRRMGTGDIAATPGSRSANALWVIDEVNTRRVVTRDPFVAWPSKGYFPYQLLPARWSLSYPDADFMEATVLMTRGGESLPVRLEPVRDGYADNTLVWIPENQNPNNPAHPPAPEADTTVSVIVDNVLIHGASVTLSYSVTVFDPLQ